MNHPESLQGQRNRRRCVVSETYLGNRSQFPALAEALKQLFIIHHQRTLHETTTSTPGK
jgi:hypothetical protein